MSESSQNFQRTSSTEAFADLVNALDCSVSPYQAAELLAAFRNAVRAEAFTEAATELTNLPFWYTADLHEDWETGVQEAAKRMQEKADTARDLAVTA